MPITPEDIDRLRSSQTENQQLEFKTAKTHYDFDKLCQYCVAIANEGGGLLLLGIQDKFPREVVGQLLSRIWQRRNHSYFSYSIFVLLSWPLTILTVEL